MLVQRRWTIGELKFGQVRIMEKETYVEIKDVARL